MNETRIKAAQRIDAALEEVNKPLLTLLLRLINTSTLPTVKGGAAVKTLHSYADELLEFYINECFDGDAVKRGRCDMLETADELSARSNGFARLLAYLGAEEDAKSLTEYAKTLVDAYYEADDILTSTPDSHCDNDECAYFDDCECKQNGPRCRTCDDCIYCGECICCPDRNGKDDENDEEDDVDELEIDDVGKDANSICPRKVKRDDEQYKTSSVREPGDENDEAEDDEDAKSECDGEEESRDETSDKDEEPGVRKPVNEDLEGVYRLFCEVFGLNPDTPKEPEKKPEPKEESQPRAKSSEEESKLSDEAIEAMASVLAAALTADMMRNIYVRRPARRIFPDFWRF